MMETMHWNDALKVGHGVIDRNHREFVSLINELGGAMSVGRGQEVCGKVLDELATYTERCFATEDQLMREHRYAAASDHRMEHAKLAQKVNEFREKYEAGMPVVSVFLLHFLMEWLTHHGLESDKTLAREISR